MIRKSTFHLNFANSGKQAELAKIMREAQRIINVYINILWSLEKFTGKFISLKTDTFLSARLQQACSKQALDIVKSQRKKKVKHRPELKKLVIQLDSRFVTFLPLENSFDFWIKFSSLQKGFKVSVPAHKHRHFNALVEDGWTLSKSTRLSVSGGRLVLDVYFEKEAPEPKTKGDIIGLDIGYKKLIVTSNGQFLGVDFKGLADKIARKKQDSQGFKRALLERDEYVNKTVKALDLNHVKELKIERLKDLKNGRRFHKQFQAKFQRWTYPGLVKRLQLVSERSGVLVTEIDPAFTSSTCSQCGTQDRDYRRSEKFKCLACGHEADADFNASVNISRKVR